MRLNPRVPVRDNQPTVMLLAGHRPDGDPVFEEVPVRPVADGRYQILASPGMVFGIAADDVFELDETTGQFSVQERSGNIAIQVFYLDELIAERLDEDLAPAISRLGGTWDGHARGVTVFTLPLAVGFETIDRLMAAWVATVPSAEWSYGNVYDELDRPLRWWEEPPFGASPSG